MVPTWEGMSGRHGVKHKAGTLRHATFCYKSDFGWSTLPSPKGPDTVYLVLIMGFNQPPQKVTRQWGLMKRWLITRAYQRSILRFFRLSGHFVPALGQTQATALHRAGLDVGQSTVRACRSCQLIFSHVFMMFRPTAWHTGFATFCYNALQCVSLSCRIMRALLFCNFVV